MERVLAEPFERYPDGRRCDDKRVLAEWPVERPRNWTARVNVALRDEQLEGVRACVDRGRPLGDDKWVAETAERLGLRFTLRGPGRPRNEENQ